MKIRTAVVAMMGASVLLGSVTACGSQAGSGAGSKITTRTSHTTSKATGVAARENDPLAELVAKAPDVPEDQATHLWSNIQWDSAHFDLPGPLATTPDVKLIVAGTIESIESGPILFARSLDDPQAEQQIVMAVKVAVTLKGETPASGMVYVQLDGNWPLEQYREGLPVGTVVGLYLENPPQAGVDWPVGSPDSGRPQGEPVWQVGPQSLLAADGPDGGVIFPVGSEIAREKSFVSQLPKQG
jgi:hypothetical protein